MAHSPRQREQTIIVAANEPEPVAEMLWLARQLITSAQARIFVLTVAVGSAEEEDEAIEQIEQFVAEQAEAGVPVKSLVVNASNVARGILDVAREYRADLIVLGLSRDPAQRAGVGTIAENVAATTNCPLVIYRLGHRDVQQVAIACAENDLATAALRVGVRLAERLELPAELLTISSAEHGGAARRYLRRRLSELGFDPELPRRHLNGGDPVRAVFQAITPQTLLVTGYDYVEDEAEEWFYSRVARALLHGAEGPVALVIREQADQTEEAHRGVLSQFVRWIRPTLTPVEQREMLSQAEQMSRTSLDYNVLVVISAILATLGLLANSGAVIIGAMLVAPLMSPLIGFAASSAGGRLVVVGRALQTILTGFLVAFVVAWLIGSIGPDILVTPEMSSRGNPTLADLGVALAGGVIAAYAQARKEIPAALAGVAIAAALMPPICTVGLAVAIGNTALSQGSLLLFITNISAIVFAAGATFLYLGMRPRAREGTSARQIGSAIGIVTFGLIMVLVVVLAVNPLSNARIERALRSALPEAELVAIEVRRSTPLRIIATVRYPSDQLLSAAEASEARDAIATTLGQPVQLELVVQEVLRSSP